MHATSLLMLSFHTICSTPTTSIMRDPAKYSPNEEKKPASPPNSSRLTYSTVFGFRTYTQETSLNAKRKGLQYGLPDLCTYSLEHMHRGSSSPNPPSCRVPRINSTRSPDRCIYVLGLTEDLQALRLACSSAEIILAGL